MTASSEEEGRPAGRRPDRPQVLQLGDVVTRRLLPAAEPGAIDRRAPAHD